MDTAPVRCALCADRVRGGSRCFQSKNFLFYSRDGGCRGSAVEFHHGNSRRYSEKYSEKRAYQWHMADDRGENIYRSVSLKQGTCRRRSNKVDIFKRACGQGIQKKANPEKHSSECVNQRIAAYENPLPRPAPRHQNVASLMPP